MKKKILSLFLTAAMVVTVFSGIPLVVKGDDNVTVIADNKDVSSENIFEEVTDKQSVVVKNPTVTYWVKNSETGEFEVKATKSAMTTNSAALYDGIGSTESSASDYHSIVGNSAAISEGDLYVDITYDLGSKKNISDILIYNHSTSSLRTQQYTLFASNHVINPTETTIIEYDNSASHRRNLFQLKTPVEAQYITMRVYKSAGNHDSKYIRLCQFNVYGTKNVTITSDNTISADGIENSSLVTSNSSVDYYKLNSDSGQFEEVSSTAVGTPANLYDGNFTNESYIAGMLFEDDSADPNTRYVDGTKGYVDIWYDLGSIQEVSDILLIHHSTQNLITGHYLVYASEKLENLYKDGFVSEYRNYDNKYRRQIFSFDESLKARYVGIRVYNPMSVLYSRPATPGIRLFEFNVFGTGNITVISDNATENLTPAGKTELAPYRLYGQSFVADENGNFGVRSNTQVAAVNANDARNDGKSSTANDALFYGNLAFTSYADTLDGSEYFVDVVYDLGSPQRITDIVLAHRTGNLMTKSYELYVTDRYSVKSDIDDSDLIYSDYTNTTSHQQFTFTNPKTAQYVILRVFNPTSGSTSRAIRLTEFNVFGTKKYDVTITASSPTTDVEAFAAVADKLSVTGDAATMSKSKFYKNDGNGNFVNTSNYNGANVGRYNDATLFGTDGNSADNNPGDSNSIFSTAKDVSPFEQYIDGTICYRDIYWDLGSYKLVSDVLINHHTNTGNTLTTGYYALYASKTLDNLYSEDNLISDYSNYGTQKHTQQLFTFATPIKAQYVGIRVYNPIPTFNLSAYLTTTTPRLREFNVYGEQSSTADLSDGVNVVEDNTTTAINPPIEDPDVTALAPYRAYAQKYIRNTETGKFDDCIANNIFVNATPAQLTNICDGEIGTNEWLVGGSSFADYTSKYDAHDMFVDVVYDLGTTANITNILLGHRSDDLMTTQFDIYVTDSYSVKADLPEEDKIASYGPDSKNTFLRNLFTLNKTGQYVIVRVYQPVTGADNPNIRLAEFNVFGTKLFDTTITSKTDDTNNDYFTDVDNNKALPVSDISGSSYRLNTDTGAYDNVSNYISDATRLTDGIFEDNNCDIGEKFMDTTNEDTATVSYIDGKNFYTTVTYDLGELCIVEDILLVHAIDSNLQTGLYEVYASDVEAELYNEENRIVNFSNLASKMKKSQLIHFNTPINAQYVGIKVLNPTQNIDTTSVSKNYNVRLREFRVYGEASKFVDTEAISVDVDTYNTNYIANKTNLLSGKTPVATKVFKDAAITDGSNFNFKNFTDNDASTEGTIGSGVIWVTDDKSQKINDETVQYVDVVWKLDSAAQIDDLSLYFKKDAVWQASHYKVAFADDSFDVNAKNYNDIFSNKSKYVEITSASAGMKFTPREGKLTNVSYVLLRIICGVNEQMNSTQNASAHYARFASIDLHGKYHIFANHTPITDSKDDYNSKYTNSETNLLSGKTPVATKVFKDNAITDGSNSNYKHFTDNDASTEGSIGHNVYWVNIDETTSEVTTKIDDESQQYVDIVWELDANAKIDDLSLYFKDEVRWLASHYKVAFADSSFDVDAPNYDSIFKTDDKYIEITSASNGMLFTANEGHLENVRYVLIRIICGINTIGDFTQNYFTARFASIDLRGEYDGFAIYKPITDSRADYNSKYTNSETNLLSGIKPIATKKNNNGTITSGSHYNSSYFTDNNASLLEGSTSVNSEGTFGSGVLWCDENLTKIDDENVQYVDTVWKLAAPANIKDLTLYFHNDSKCQASHYKVAFADSSFDVDAPNYDSIFKTEGKFIEINSASAGMQIIANRGKLEKVSYVLIRMICGINAKISDNQSSHYARFSSIDLRGDYDLSDPDNISNLIISEWQKIIADKTEIVLAHAFQSDNAYINESTATYSPILSEVEEYEGLMVFEPDADGTNYARLTNGVYNKENFIHAEDYVELYYYFSRTDTGDDAYQRNVYGRYFTGGQSWDAFKNTDGAWTKFNILKSDFDTTKELKWIDIQKIDKGTDLKFTQVVGRKKLLLPVGYENFNLADWVYEANLIDTNKYIIEGTQLEFWLDLAKEYVEKNNVTATAKYSVDAGHYPSDAEEIDERENLLLNKNKAASFKINGKKALWDIWCSQDYRYNKLVDGIFDSNEWTYTDVKYDTNTKTKYLQLNFDLGGLYDVDTFFISHHFTSSVISSGLSQGEYEVYASKNSYDVDSAENRIILYDNSSDSVKGSTAAQTFKFKKEVVARYISLRITEAYTDWDLADANVNNGLDGRYVRLTEVGVYGGKHTEDPNTPVNLIENMPVSAYRDKNLISDTDFGKAQVTMLYDGDYAKGINLSKGDSTNVSFVYDLLKTQSINSITVKAASASITAINIYKGNSSTGALDATTAENNSYSGTATDTVTLEFTEPLSTRHLRIEVVCSGETVDISEFEVMGTAAEKVAYYNLLFNNKNFVSAFAKEADKAAESFDISTTSWRWSRSSKMGASLDMICDMDNTTVYDFYGIGTKDTKSVNLVIDLQTLYYIDNISFLAGGSSKYWPNNMKFYVSELEADLWTNDAIQEYSDIQEGGLYNHEFITRKARYIRIEILNNNDTDNNFAGDLLVAIAELQIMGMAYTDNDNFGPYIDSETGIRAEIPKTDGIEYTDVTSIDVELETVNATQITNAKDNDYAFIGKAYTVKLHNSGGNQITDINGNIVNIYLPAPDGGTNNAKVIKQNADGTFEVVSSTPTENVGDGKQYLQVTVNDFAQDVVYAVVRDNYNNHKTTVTGRKEILDGLYQNSNIEPEDVTEWDSCKFIQILLDNDFIHAVIDEIKQEIWNSGSQGNIRKHLLNTESPEEIDYNFDGKKDVRDILHIANKKKNNQN